MCKNLSKFFYTSQVIANFDANFVDMAMGVGRGKNAIGSIRWPILENPPIDTKILQKSFKQTEL